MGFELTLSCWIPKVFDQLGRIEAARVKGLKLGFQDQAPISTRTDVHLEGSTQGGLENGPFHRSDWKFKDGLERN